VYTGYKLFDVKALRRLWNYDRGEAVIAVATLLTVVSVDLLAGVLTGLGLALAKLVYTLSHLRAEVRACNGRTELSLQGAATFIRLPKLAAALETIRPSTELHVDFRSLDYIDHACLELLTTWARQHQSTGGRLVIDWGQLHARFRGPQSLSVIAQAETVSSLEETPRVRLEDLSRKDDSPSGPRDHHGAMA
jgi:MFS superfamily sulfate permease-like transporter